VILKRLLISIVINSGVFKPLPCLGPVVSFQKCALEYLDRMQIRNISKQL